MSKYNLRRRRSNSNSSNSESQSSESNIVSSPSRIQNDENRDQIKPLNQKKNIRHLKRRFSESTNAFRTVRAEQIEGLLLFKEQPRQFLFLFLVVSLVSYYAFTHDSNDLEQNVRSAILSATLIFLVYCFLQTRDGLLIRPHPGVWRVVHGAAVMYLIVLAVISVLNIRGATIMLKILFPEVGTHKMNHEALNCEINKTSLYNGISSIWFLAHVSGWWGKMCMFRDWQFCWVLSISFELLEMSLQFIIPDFQECWWDSLFMDLLGANMIGMFLGRWTLMYLETKEYDWSGKNPQNYGFVRRALHQLEPMSWSRYHWQVFSSFKRFAQVLIALSTCLVAELNAFFLLSTLHIPKESHINKYRLFLVFLLGIPTASEYYEFISNPECWRVGQNAWLMFSIICFEILVWVKFLPEIISLDQRPPPDVYIPWILFFIIFSIWSLLYFGRHQNKKQYKTIQSWQWDNVLFYISFLPLIYLIKQLGYS